MASATDAANRCLVIIPAYNEGGSIARVVAQVREAGWDVVVVDDGSTDRTAALAAEAGAPVLRLPFNLGIGGAMQTGYRYAQMRGYDAAVQVDADGQHPPEQIGGLVDRLRASEADMVIGSRFLEAGGYEQSLARMTGIRVLRGLIRLLCGLKLTDCTSGFRVAGRRAIGAFAQWYPDDYPEPEVALLLHRAGFRVEEVPVRMEQRTTGRTSIPVHRGVFYVLKVSLALMLDMIRRPWEVGSGEV